MINKKSLNTTHPRVQTVISDGNEDFLGLKEDEAIEQHKSIVKVALKAAAPEWTFEQINFVAGRRGAVVDTISITSLKV